MYENIDWIPSYSILSRGPSLKMQKPIRPIISASIHQMALARKFPDLANYFFLEVSKIWFMDKDKCNISVK